MQLNDPLLRALVLEDAIDRNPLVVSPDLPLVDAVALMSQIRGSQCVLPEASHFADPSPIRRSSCILVMQEAQLLGIVTERDIVRLTAAEQDFQRTSIADVMVHPVITLPRSAFQDIFAALFLFRRYRIRHLAIVDETDRLVGVVSPETIRGAMRPANLLKLRRVSDVMTTQIVHASPNTSVLELARLMAERLVSCVVIAKNFRNPHSGDEIVNPIGIITERDIVQMQSLHLNLAETAAEAVMSTPLFLLSPEDTLWTAHHEMQRRHVRRLIVSWNWGRGLGIITQTNLLRVFDPLEMSWAIEALQQTIDRMNADTGAIQQYQASNLSFELPQETRCEPKEPLLEKELHAMLANLRGCLERLVNQLEAPADARQIQLNLALAYLDRLEAIVRRGNGEVTTND
jgi:CBS domain-containing protein